MKGVYYLYFTVALCQGFLYLLLILLLLRQILPFFGKRPSALERRVGSLTQWLLFVGDCFCRMLGIPLHRGGIDFRYPMTAVILWICVMAITVR